MSLLKRLDVTNAQFSLAARGSDAYQPCAVVQREWWLRAGRYNRRASLCYSGVYKAGIFKVEGHERVRMPTIRREMREKEIEDEVRGGRWAGKGVEWSQRASRTEL